MKRWMVFFLGLVAGVGIGWYLGLLIALPKIQREMFQKEQALKQEVEATTDFLTKQSKEESRLAAPSERSAALIALVGLNDLDATNIKDARFRFSTLAAIYYRAHLHDGDTNVLEHIKNCAMTNAALSNAIVGKMP